MLSCQPQECNGTQRYPGWTGLHWHWLAAAQGCKSHLSAVLSIFCQRLELELGLSSCPAKLHPSEGQSQMQTNQLSYLSAVPYNHHEEFFLSSDPITLNPANDDQRKC